VIVAVICESSIVQTVAIIRVIAVALAIRVRKVIRRMATRNRSVAIPFAVDLEITRLRRRADWATMRITQDNTV